MARATKALDEAAPDQEQTQDEPRQDGGTFTQEMRGAIREAAVEVLRPVARKATTSAAKYAVTRGPDMVKDRLGDVGGAAGLKDGALGKVGDLTGKLGRKGKSADGTGRGRRLPVQEYVDVAVPLEVAYDRFTQFEDWPQFMHRVEKVEQRDEETLSFHENIWGVRRQWEAAITEQEPCERIAWRSESGTQTAGVVTFHRLADSLTRVYVNLDFQPQGILEKAASGMRMSRRALRSDLMRFKAHVEMEPAEEREDRDEPEPESEPKRRSGRFARSQERDEEEPEADEEEPEAYEEDEELEEEEEEEEQPRPRRRRTAKAKAKARR